MIFKHKHKWNWINLADGSYNDGWTYLCECGRESLNGKDVVPQTEGYLTDEKLVDALRQLKVTPWKPVSV